MGNCRETLDRLYQYLDRELSDAEQRIVQQHLERCPPCRDLFQFEANVLTFVGRRCRETAAPPSLRDRVQKLSGQSSSV